MLLTLRDRMRRRLHGNDDDSGFMLIYVLMITSIVTILVTSTLVVSGNSIVPAVQSAYGQAAQAAAQGGVNAFVAYADKWCSGDSASVSTCTLPSNFSNTTTIYSAGGYTSTYVWKADKDPQGRYFRVTSQGTTSQGGLTVSRTITADVAGGASSNVLDYGVVTGFETQSSASVLALQPNRTIYLDATGIANATVPIKGNTINWDGASPGSAAGKVGVCNATMSGSHGRGGLLPNKAPNPYVDWSESSTGGNHYTHFAPCTTAWASMTKLLPPANPGDGAGGYASDDALFISNSYPGGSGPLFDQPVETTFSYNDVAGQGICGTQVGQNYRAFDLSCAGYPVNVGGTIDPASTYPPPVSVKYLPSVPTSTPVIPATACVYNGPTRVLLKSDGTAVVTSPQTTSTWVSANAAARPAQCYSGAGGSGVGMAGVTISLVGPVVIHVLSVQNDGTAPPSTPAIHVGSSGWNTTGQRRGDTATTTNTVFDVTGSAPPASPSIPTSSAADDSGCAANSYSATVGATCAWTNLHSATDGNSLLGLLGGWTANSGSSCAALPSDRALFECEYPGGYSAYRAAARSALAGSACTDAGCVNGVLATALAPATVAGAHRYIVSTGASGASTTTVSTVSSNAAPLSSDPFYDSTTVPGTPTTQQTVTTPTTYTIARQTWNCYVLGAVALNSVCDGGSGSYGWGDGLIRGNSTPQFSVTVSAAVTTIKDAGSAGVSYFPSMKDVTQYSMGNNTFDTSGPGDLYVEGTTPNTLTLVAQNDAIVTGSLSAVTPTAATIELVAQNNVRIYHPVKCVVTDATAIAATTQGFCPDDITGLYSGVLANGKRPDQQYTNMRPDLANLTINGAVFALGNAPIKFVCPSEPGMAAVCGGEFTTDNFDKGDSTAPAGAPLGAVTVTGTVAMAHHAPMGEEWEIPDTTGQTGRPYSGYEFNERYQNLKQLLASVSDASNVLRTVTSTSSLWHIVSFSAGGS